LCAWYSVVTVGPHHPVSRRAGRQVARTILAECGPGATVLIAIRRTDADREFAAAIQRELESRGGRVLRTVEGAAAEVRAGLAQIAAAGETLHAVATHQVGSEWGPLQPDRLAALGRQHPALGTVRVFQPRSYPWPSFFTRQNLLNVINHNVAVAIIAIGMTMVIITAGIDLSVGSLLALSAVLTAVSLQTWGGGAGAGTAAVLACGLLGIGVSGLCGAFSGVMVTYFRVPAFIVTLSLMMIARGLAFMIAVRYQGWLEGGGTEGTPEAVRVQTPSFDWLGNGATLGIPNAIWLMAALYLLAHLVMTRTSLGRYIYAVGGNVEAARLSGVPVFGVLILVYALCGGLAGLSGIVDASRFNSGRPNAGLMYELQVIAAVVVGGTSLAGGEGRIVGTLLGALIIAVIQNGLNMAGVTSYEQMVVFGLLILAAVLLDQWKKRR
jgi:ribose transport system permease protein